MHTASWQGRPIDWFGVEELASPHNDRPSRLRIREERAAVGRSQYTSAPDGAGPLDIAFAELDRAPIDADLIELVASHREAALPRLFAELATPSPRSIAAAAVLALLGEAAGVDYLREVLELGPIELRRLALERLEDPLSDLPAVRENADLQRAVIAQLHAGDAELMLAAIDASGAIEAAGYQEEFIGLLTRTTSPVRNRLSYWLSRRPLSVEQREVLLARLFWEYDSLDAETICALAGSPDRAIAMHAKRRLRRLIGKLLPRLEALPPSSPDRQSIELTIGVLVLHADEADLPWLRVLSGAPLSPFRATQVRLARQRLEATVARRA